MSGSIYYTTSVESQQLYICKKMFWKLFMVSTVLIIFSKVALKDHNYKPFCERSLNSLSNSLDVSIFDL